MKKHDFQVKEQIEPKKNNKILENVWTDMNKAHVKIIEQEK